MVSRKLQTLANRFEERKTSFAETARICFNKRAMNHSYCCPIVFFDAAYKNIHLQNI